MEVRNFYQDSKEVMVMSKHKLVMRIIIIVFVVVLTVSIGLVIGGLYLASKVPIRAEKNYAIIVVSEGEIADYTVFIQPKGKYKRLAELDIKVQYRIANYMRENNLKLAEGQQKFCALRDATFKELIEQDFKFEKINEEYP